MPIYKYVVYISENINKSFTIDTSTKNRKKLEKNESREKDFR